MHVGNAPCAHMDAIPHWPVSLFGNEGTTIA